MRGKGKLKEEFMKNILKLMRAAVAVVAVAIAGIAMAETEVVDGITWIYTVKGEFSAYGKAYSASGSATLIPLSEPVAEDVEKPEEKSFDGCVFMYLPPKAGKFDGFAMGVRLKWTGTEFVLSEAE